jgi:hypothetical protein
MHDAQASKTSGEGACSVIPMKTGIQVIQVVVQTWTPAFAGVKDF